MNRKEQLEKYKDVIPYLFFGVCTTAVNMIGYWFLAYLCNWGMMLSTVLAWFLALIFAYVTNRKWVFKSEAKNPVDVVREAFSFFICRLSTGIVDWGSMLLFVGVFHLNDMFSKLTANIIVILLNYIASKRIIFKKSK